MTKNSVKLLTGFIGLATLATFILGLAQSISSGFAGFWGGLPFWVIAVTVLSLATYDFWDECVRKRR